MHRHTQNYYLFWTQLMCTTLEMAANKWKCNNVPILSWKFQTHVELIFKYFAIETVTKI